MTEKYLSPNLEQTASYIIYTDGATIYALNGSTGKIDYSGTDASSIIQNAINQLTSGGMIILKRGEYQITSKISIDTPSIVICGECDEIWAQYKLTKITAPSLDDDVFEITKSNVIIKNIAFYNIYNAIHFNVDSYDVVKPTVEECSFENIRNIGILFESNSSYVMISPRLEHLMFRTDSTTPIAYIKFTGSYDISDIVIDDIITEPGADYHIQVDSSKKIVFQKIDNWYAEETDANNEIFYVRGTGISIRSITSSYFYSPTTTKIFDIQINEGNEIRGINVTTTWFSGGTIYMRDNTTSSGYLGDIFFTNCRINSDIDINSSTKYNIKNIVISNSYIVKDISIKHINSVLISDNKHFNITIDVSNTANYMIINNMPYTTGASLSIANASTLGIKVIKNNPSYKTENSDIVTITAGNTSIDVTHGLAIEPDINKIRLSPQDDLGGRSIWVEAHPTAPETYFVIKMSSLDSSDHTIGWSYEN